jgi:hypothetical protein
MGSKILVRRLTNGRTSSVRNEISGCIFNTLYFQPVDFSEYERYPHAAMLPREVKFVRAVVKAC